MTFRKLTPNDILPLISDYLNKAGLPEISEQLSEFYKSDLPHPLQKYSLVKMIKLYIQNKKKLHKHFLEEENQDNDEEKSEEKEVLQQKKQKKRKQHIITESIDIHSQEIQQNNQDELQTEENPRKQRFFQKCNDDDIHKIRNELRDNTFEAKQRFGSGDAYGELGNEKLKFTKGEMFKKEKGKLKNRQFQGMGEINMYAINSIKL